MIKFDKILADHDDVYTHGTMLYAQATDLDYVYADKKCTIPVDGEVLKDIYLKGCVVAIVNNGDIVGPFVKPVVLDTTDGVYKLALEVEERLEGDGAEYYTLAPTALSFRSSAPLSELQNVQLNGEVVDPSNYTLTEGSTIVTFPVEYLKTLNTGKYEVAVNSSSKTVKGNFTVAAPSVNDYGFYYNQPYTGYVAPLDENWVFFIREGGTMDVIILETGYTEVASYIIDGSDITVTGEGGVYTGSITSEGIYCNEVMTTFAIGNDKIVADADYIYVYKEDLGGYEVTAIDKSKTKYGSIKTGLNGFDTVKIADSAFSWCTSLTNVVIPEGVTSIGDRAFFQCTSLASVILGNGITSIGDWAFAACTSLANVSIPDSVTSIGNYAFNECLSLTSVTIPEGVTSIGDSAFLWCISLTSVDIPEGVTSIGNSVFNGCSSLTNVVIPDSATSIGEAAFNGCTSLTTVVIPEGVTSIGDSAFRSCTSLTNVAIPDSVPSIGLEAFYYCESLTDVVIPDSVTSMDYRAFGYCTSLTNVVISEGVTSIGEEAFSVCYKLDNITFNGTIAQWNAITKGPNWNYRVPATHVQCSDGTVALK